MRKLAIAIACGAVSGGILLYAAPFALRGCYVSHGPHSYHKVKSDILAIESACAEYAIQGGGEYPPDLEALVIPDEQGFTFLKKDRVPLDPWGNSYGYERPGPEHTLRIFTHGSDGAPGGKGDARDVDNLMIKNHEI